MFDLILSNSFIPTHLKAVTLYSAVIFDDSWRFLAKYSGPSKWKGVSAFRFQSNKLITQLTL